MDKAVNERVELSDGAKMPRLGLGVARLTDDDACAASVRAALAAGYRHFDTGQIYKNEAIVGRALRESGVDRADLFVTTKLDVSHPDPVEALHGSLSRMGFDYVDMYLVHWPQDGPTAWPAMEQALDAGLTISIGVSNFSLREIDELLESARIRPVVNQVQFNPYRYRQALLEGCAQRGIELVAYAPLGMMEQEPLEHPTVAGIAVKLGKAPAQIMLRWGLQRGVTVIPKSANPDRIALNAQLFDFELDPESLAALDALDLSGRSDQAREVKFWER